MYVCLHAFNNLSKITRLHCMRNPNKAIPISTPDCDQQKFGYNLQYIFGQQVNLVLEMLVFLFNNAKQKGWMIVCGCRAVTRGYIQHQLWEATGRQKYSYYYSTKYPTHLQTWFMNHTTIKRCTDTLIVVKQKWLHVFGREKQRKTTIIIKKKKKLQNHSKQLREVTIKILMSKTIVTGRYKCHSQTKPSN